MILPKIIPFAVQLALLCHKASAQSAVVNWDWYPTASRVCFESAQSTIQCPTDNVPDFNGCVCGDGFLELAALCIGSNDNGDLTNVYNVLVRNCATSNTPVPIALSQWLSWATPISTPTTTTSPTAAAATSSTTVVTTHSSTTTPVSSISTTSSTTAHAVGSSTSSTPILASSGGGKSKLGTGAIIGLAIGITGLCAIVGLLGLILLRMSRRKSQEGHRFEGEPGDNGSYGTSPGTAVVEAYKKERPESSIPSTVSPNPSNRVSGFSIGQGAMPYAIPPQQQYVGQAHYPQQFHQMPPGQPYQPPYPAGQQYVQPTESMHDIPYPHPGTYSEMSSGTPAQMPGTRYVVPQGGYHELPGPGPG